MNNSPLATQLHGLFVKILSIKLAVLEVIPVGREIKGKKDLENIISKNSPRFYHENDASLNLSSSRLKDNRCCFALRFGQSVNLSS